MIQVLRELFFPPVCTHCKEEAIKPYFCDACWELSALLDPKLRCRHCFCELQNEGVLCASCAHRPSLPFPRAALFEKNAPIAPLAFREEMAESFASFAAVLWDRLQWPVPDLILPIPPQRKAVAKLLASSIQCSCMRGFIRKGWPREEWELAKLPLTGDETVLLFDLGCSPLQLRRAVYSLLEAFPKKGFVLSLTL